MNVIKSLTALKIMENFHLKNVSLINTPGTSYKERSLRNSHFELSTEIIRKESFFLRILVLLFDKQTKQKNLHKLNERLNNVF